MKMKSKSRWLSLTVPMLAAGVSMAQPPERLISPDVHPNKSVTFRLKAPNAKDVILAREGAEPVAMQKDEKGIWTVTVGPLEPDLYGYSFSVDGVTLTDPSNPVTKPNFIWPSSMVHVSGPPSLPWEVGDVPHGVLHRHFYRSAIVGDDRDFYVYTPPGYDPSGETTYPVLYLLHGFSDDAGGWTAVGRAHTILDNLIAAGRAKPMLVVMPLGYGAPEIVRPGNSASRANLWQKNMDGARDALLKEVIPAIEKLYRVSRQRDARAIAGLSMGGTQALYTGLNAVDHFAWIGAFSSGGIPGDLTKTFPSAGAEMNDQLKLLWVVCGRSDSLIDSNRKFIDWLKSRGVQHDWKETEGAHTWMVWRRNLAEFVPLLF